MWSHNAGQQIPLFNRCQLVITWMFDIKEVHDKSRLHVSVNLLEYDHAPKSKTTSPDNHEKINSRVSFSFLYVFRFLF